jgi:hypothetical protein
MEARWQPWQEREFNLRSERGTCLCIPVLLNPQRDGRRHFLSIYVPAGPHLQS